MEIEIVTKHKRKKKILATKKAIAKLLIEIMREHIGRENSIRRNDLFKKVYGLDPYDINELQELALWSILKSALHFLRQRTKCFVTNARTADHDIEYFVVKEIEDAICYSDIVQRITRQMKAMEKRAYKAVQEGWYELEWVVDDAE
jgi:hypothetical protein